MERTARKKILLLAVVVFLLVSVHPADGQPKGKVPRIGVLLLGLPPMPSAPSPNLEAFRQGLRELGYMEGKNIAIEFRYAEGKLARLPGLAEELMRLRVDIIVATPAAAALAARGATSTIPIVTRTSADLIAAGLIASLARPGGNVTGIISLSGELIGKRLELLKEAFPRVSRVAILTRTGVPGTAGWLKETEAAGRSLGIEVQVLEVRGPKDLDSAFEAAMRGRVGAVIEMPNPVFHQNRKRIVDFAAKHRLPTVFHSTDFVEAGGLMAYGANYPDLHRRLAYYVDRILKGAKPADFPVEQPTKFQLVINLKAAKALGLTIPPEVLFRADRVIR